MGNPSLTPITAPLIDTEPDRGSWKTAFLSQGPPVKGWEGQGCLKRTTPQALALKQNKNTLRLWRLPPALPAARDRPSASARTSGKRKASCVKCQELVEHSCLLYLSLSPIVRQLTCNLTGGCWKTIPPPLQVPCYKIGGRGIPAATQQKTSQQELNPCSILAS